MLIGHATAPRQTLSMKRIASFGNYESYATANIWYGKLGRLFADHFGIEGLVNQTYAIAYVSCDRSEEGHFQWTLHPELLVALQRLALIKRKGQRFVATSHSSLFQRVGSKPSRVEGRRAGQVPYKKRMSQLWDGKCAVTGCSVKTTLIASHAKPWAECSNDEKVDEFNGLLLSASLDKLFGKGLISFADNGRILTSRELTERDLAALGLSKKSRLSFVDARHKPYLQAHRKAHGFAP
jgi:hypothetical protein